MDRHLQDVHEIYDDTKKEKGSREIGDYNYWQRNIDSNNNFWITSNNIDKMNYNQRSYSNTFPNTFPNPGYYHGEHFSNFNSLSKEEKRLNVDDRIKIQKVLKILKNTLEKIYSTTYVVCTISWLHYRCLSEKSDEPIKKFLVQNNMGYLWPFE